MRGTFKRWITIGTALAVTGTTATVGAAMFTAEEHLGRMLYFDKSLSNPAGQSCADCHLPRAGFADPDQNLPVSEGVIPGRFGGRNSPSSAYAAFSPYFGVDPATGQYTGGQFWDGRATTLKEQAKGPFLNPVEMNNTMEGVVAAVTRSHYADLFRYVYGSTSLDNIEAAYDQIAQAIAAFEGSRQVNRFSSKFDASLKKRVKLSAQEQRGLNLFNGQGKCFLCHPSTSRDGGVTPPLFTDYTYDNLGIPKNTEYPFNILMLPPDLGLGGFLADPGQDGKFKVPTLRNIALTAPYGHNGYFKTLKEIVHYYNTRDIPGLWPSPEVADNLNTTEIGNLGLTPQQEDDIVAFLMALTDGYSR